MISACAARTRSWPSMPISSSRIWRGESRSWSSVIDAKPPRVGCGAFPRRGRRQRPGKTGSAASLVSRHRSSVGLRWASKRIAALHRLPISSVLAARCALRYAPMAARSLRHLIRDATLAWAAPVSRGAAQHHAGPGHARSIVFLFFLALRQRFADQHRMTLELIERLLQLEVLVGAKLRRPAVGDGLFGLVLQAQAGFFAGFFTGLVLLFFALAAAQVLVQVGLAPAQSGKQVALL